MRGIDRVVHVCATDSKTWKVQQWPVIPLRKMIMNIFTESKKIDFKWSAQNHLGFNTVSKCFIPYRYQTIYLSHFFSRLKRLIF